MEGAREYARLFKTGQYGKLYLVSSSHARGDTFHIYVLPQGEAAIPNGGNNGPLNKDAVEVYGIIDGQPGWTERYGWLHEGRWIADFDALVVLRRQEIANNEARIEKDKAEAQNQAEIATKLLLAKY